MGAGGGNLSTDPGAYYNGQPINLPKFNVNPGQFGPATPAGYSTGGTPLAGQGFNQSQQNYIQNQGKLPPGFGGTALSAGQQNFFANKGYLPPGVTGNSLTPQYYRPQPQQPNQQYNPYGAFKPYGVSVSNDPAQQLGGSNKGGGAPGLSA